MRLYECCKIASEWVQASNSAVCHAESSWGASTRSLHPAQLRMGELPDCGKLAQLGTGELTAWPECLHTHSLHPFQACRCLAASAQSLCLVSVSFGFDSRPARLPRTVHRAICGLSTCVFHTLLEDSRWVQLPDAAGRHLGRRICTVHRLLRALVWRA